MYYGKQEFDFYQQAADYLEAKNFKRNTKKKTHDGAKTYFFCASLSECSARCYIYEDFGKKNFQIFESKGEHDHDEKLKTKPEPKLTKISSEVQKEVIKLAVERKMKPKYIIEEISERFPEEITPTAKQIHYILSKHRDEVLPPVVCVGDLVNWCFAKCRFPDNDDEAFVLGYENNEPEDEMYFRFVISTKNLLKQCSNVDMLCTDASYKVNWNGFPMIVLGTVDKNIRFHPLALVSSSNETEADYAFVFVSIRNAIQALYKKNFTPRFLVADGAQAIENAFKKVFGGTVIMCYAHVRRNCETRAFANAKQNKDKILHDIAQMQLSSNPTEFKKASDLFLQKWSSEEKDLRLFRKNLVTDPLKLV